MPDSQDTLYLLAYDIANPKRLAKIHRTLKKNGMQVQYSVFTIVLTRKALMKILACIEELINRREDDVRCYRLPRNPEIVVLGQQYFSEDVMLFTDGVNRILTSHVESTAIAIAG